ncbi:hypothetical protein TWF970_006447 [Orbilia oligospora]|uniref:Methyltransferase n=1 Tax=Orbilia oligospora TaxID=2813651 RepID=A0A7C8VCU6_ORBOL|nr:hypothetical protein TWF970_006447 [Orbilia oligospora]
MSTPPGKERVSPRVSPRTSPKGSPSNTTDQPEAGTIGGSQQQHYIAADSADSSTEDDFWDSDNGSLMTDTTSLREQIYAQMVENGRRYNANSAGKSDYQFPVDEMEQDRLDLMHHIFKLLLHGDLYISPIGPNPQRILDIGTGTGIWAIEIADRFPSASVVGTDLAPIQPTWVPPNLEFQIDDCEGDWTFPKDSFDFIHIRYLRAAISDWPRLYKQAYDALRPGGYFEFQDPDLVFLTDDGSMPEDASLSQYINHFHAACEKNGKHTRGQPQSVKDELRKLGFTDIVEDVRKCPQNPWPRKDEHLKALGRYSLLNLLDGLEGFAMKLFTGILKWRKEEVDIFVAKLKQESCNKNYHMYFNYYYVSGRKPFEDEDL